MKERRLEDIYALWGEKVTRIRKKKGECAYEATSPKLVLAFTYLIRSRPESVTIRGNGHWDLQGEAGRAKFYN